jgi:hypothetical protein
VSGGEFPIDPQAPLFFLSYARVMPPKHSQVGPHEGNRHAMRLFEELSDHVSELVGRSTGADPGFMDRALDGGERWTRELLTAAGTCQVFIPLISKSYVDSDWCGTEWDTFSRRRIVRRADGSTDHETGIVPVTWAPTDAESLPAVVRDIQRFSPGGMPDPDIAAQYQHEGVYGLLTMGLEAAYRAVVWRLAQRVVAIHRSHWVERRVPNGTHQLRNVFRLEGG